MYQTRMALALALVALLGFFHRGDAEACKPIPPDTVPPISDEKAYDAVLSPAAPIVTAATLSSKESHGCESDDCGGQGSLLLDVQVPENTAMLRVDIEGEPTIYLRPLNNASSLDWNLRAWGYAEDDELMLEIRTLNMDGYVSMPVTYSVSSGRDSEGCNITGRSTSSTMILLALLFLGLRNRRRHLVW